jgi:hypothetical protein
VRFGQQTGLTFNNRHYAVGSGGSLNTQPVIHTEGDRIIRDTPHADALRAGVGHRDRGPIPIRRSST